MPRYVLEIPVLKLFTLPPSTAPEDAKSVDAGTWELSEEDVAMFLYGALSVPLRSYGTFARLKEQDIKVEKIADIGPPLKAAEFDRTVRD